MNATKYIFTAIIIIFSGFVKAQSSDDILDLLIKNGAIKQDQADSLKADLALKEQKKKEDQKLFSINSGRALQISGYTQVRFQSLQEAGKPDGFDIRRARLDFKGNISPLWEYRLQTDLAVSPKIIDAYVSYKPFDFLKVTAGQFYIPFSLENNTPDNILESIDRSQVVNALAARDKDVIGNQNGRDIGIQLSGSLIKHNDRFLADYYAGYFNGSGINVSDYNESKDVAGRLVLHPFKFIDIGGSYYNGYDAWGTPLKNQNRKRIGAELSFNYRSWSLRGEYIQGTDGTFKINNQSLDLNRAGWYVQASYFIVPKHFQVVLKYDTYDPNTFKAPENAPQNDITTYYILGLNYYFNNWAKLKVNYFYKQEQGPQINNDVIAAEFQINF